LKRPEISAKGQLAGSVAIVTGGSSGIGAATVRRLAEAGASVVIGYNKGQARARALAKKLPGSAHRIVHLPMEDTATIRAVAAEVERVYGRADILVNCAGFTKAIPHADLEALDDASIDAIFAANVRGPFATIRALAPLMRKTGGAVIVNISSVAGFTGLGSNIAYAGSKAALDTMSMSLARVLGPQIRVICVSPGAVDTDFVPGRGRAVIERQAQASPLKEVIAPDDVALAVMACVTHLSFTTGSRVIVNGGSHL
jgi:3-oxoacyl-[acyl-carrier protein] reductase